MAKINFFYGAMNSSKSANLIIEYNKYRNMPDFGTVAFNSVLDTRFGSDSTITSRTGLSINSIAYDASFNFFNHCIDCEYLRVIFIDEAQFLTLEHIDQLLQIVDTLNIDVNLYGLRTDYTGALFPASAKLFAIADNIIEMKSYCFCGECATTNARLSNETDQVVVGASNYKSFCRKHYNEFMSAK
jgi:thymidine kinase